MGARGGGSHSTGICFCFFIVCCVVVVLFGLCYFFSLSLFIDFESGVPPP